MANKRITKKFEDRDHENLDILVDVLDEERDIKRMFEDYPHLKEEYMERLKQNEFAHRHFHGKSGIHPSHVSMDVLRHALQDLKMIKSGLIRDIDEIEAEEYRKKKSSKVKPKRKVVKKCKCK